jgi:hypothetical protein
VTLHDEAARSTHAANAANALARPSDAWSSPRIRLVEAALQKNGGREFDEAQNGRAQHTV